jgi:hypothetical protein
MKKLEDLARAGAKVTPNSDNSGKNLPYPPKMFLDLELELFKIVLYHLCQ